MQSSEFTKSVNLGSISKKTAEKNLIFYNIHLKIETSEEFTFLNRETSRLTFGFLTFFNIENLILFNNWENDIKAKKNKITIKDKNGYNFSYNF